MRLHLFEFNDQPWLPAVLRDAQTGYLETVSRRFELHKKMAPILAAALRDSNTDCIVDLCSGSGGPILEIQAMLEPRPRVVLTDKFPSRAVFDAIDQPGVTAVREPVDAVSVPAELRGLRTIINAFHHFRPDAARGILVDAAARQQPIAIIEISERAVRSIVLTPLIILFVLLMMPMVRPSRWQYWVFCYLIPILPLMTFWDGLASNLRSFTCTELLALTEGLDAGYEWRCERQPLASGMAVTVLVGLPNPR